VKDDDDTFDDISQKDDGYIKPLSLSLSVAAVFLGAGSHKELRRLHQDSLSQWLLSFSVLGHIRN